MEITELMVGDIVQYLDGKKLITVVVVKVDGSGNVVRLKQKNGHKFNTTIDFLRPMPLTPDILEKNGFKEYIPENHLETVYACQDVSKAVANELYALWPYQDGSFYLLLRVDGKDMVRMNIHYVHQLQHAFSLCETDITISLP